MYKHMFDYRDVKRRRVKDPDFMDYITAQLSRNECCPFDEEACNELLRQLTEARTRLFEDITDYSPAEDLGAMFRKNGQVEAATIFDRLVKANLRLCALLARRYRAAGNHPMHTLPDLFNSASIGLMRGLARFDRRQDSCVADYVCWSINNAMDEWIGARRTQSIIDRKWNGCGGEDRIDADQDGADVFVDVSRKEDADMVRSTISRFLTEKERQMIELRFGEDLTLKEAAAEMGNTYQAVRKLQVKALAKLRWRFEVRQAVEEDRIAE